ncbi:hypothetical protein O0L34_g14600 [Tuta absoluta]|nr:hypothetical protein O0L34_g14600 [Tuta absoluta]
MYCPKPRKIQECKGVKDPCKICLQTVTKSNGIRCQGACKSWVHFKCLNYTPGRINDIKKGVITVTCPCPDCKTGKPKEFMSDEQFTCNNTSCPANSPPSCDNFDCRANEETRRMPPPCPPPGTLRACYKETCQENSSKSIPLPPSEPVDPCFSSYDPNSSNADQRKTNSGASTQKRHPHACSPSSGNAPTPPRYNEKDMTREVIQQMCKTVGALADQLNYLLDHM